ncbi:hypothetical protein AB0F17_47665 [Nonomuraea sp. NPDC026600]|uniref:hypothetical protein n=1 Tax=Nonomuraea sp. NPDC026600 TaxID=3155363 RepID=UPI0033D255D3
MTYWGHRWPVAATHLLERWGPVDTQTDLPAFRFTPISGVAPTPEDQPWTTAPTPVEVANFGRFPETFAGVGEAGFRHPVAVEVLNHAINPGPGKGGWTGARPLEEVAAEVELLLTDLLDVGPGTLDEPAQELIAGLVRKLFVCSRDYDLVRVTVAAQPGGAPLDDELHLLGRDLYGNTFRLSVAPATSLQPLGPLWPEPARLMKGEIDPPRSLNEQDYRRADLAIRASCIAEVLGELVWLTNNDRMKITVEAERHGLNLDCAAPEDADARFRSWWPKSARCTELAGEEWWDEGHVTSPHRLYEESLTRFLTDFEQHNLALAASGAWAMREIDDYDADEPQPRFPNDRLVALLGRDLFDTLTKQVANSSGNVRPLAYGIGLPFEITPEDYGFYGCLLLVGPESMGILTIEAMA